jgi:hypothetical protein
MARSFRSAHSSAADGAALAPARSRSGIDRADPLGEAPQLGQLVVVEARQVVRQGDRGAVRA